MNTKKAIGFWCVLAVFSLAAAHAAPVAKKLPQWKSPAAWSAKLAPARKFNFGEIRAPKGYSLQQKPAPGGQGAAWVGSEGTDGTRPYLMVLSLTLPEKEAKKYTAESALNSFLQGIKARHENWSRSTAERGTINGTTFIRARWSGRHREADVGMHGFIYVAKNGRSLIQMSSQQTQPDDYEALKLAEAAALTFKKK